MFCNVVIPRTPLDALTYECPPGVELLPGDFVRVPFRGREAIGVVFELIKSPPPDCNPKKIQVVASDGVVFRGLPQDLLALVRWVADYYVAYPGEVLGFALPPRMRNRDWASGKKEGYLSYSTGREGNKESGGVSVFTGENFCPAVVKFLLGALRRGSAILLAPEAQIDEWSAFLRDSGEVRGAVGDNVFEYYTGVSAAAMRRTWFNLMQLERVLVIGVRSAVWAPVRALSGVVIVDEHFPGYKEERRPGWHARDVAIARAKIASAGVLLCTHSPTLETYGNIRAGKFQLVSGLPSPAEVRRQIAKRCEIFVVDMKLHRRELLSPRLLTELKRAQKQGRAGVLILNRKGVSRKVLCRACGTVLKCGQCEIPVVLTAEARLVCRYCGATQPAPDRCPNCGAVDFEYRSPGIGMVERMLKLHGFDRSPTPIVVDTRKGIGQRFPEKTGVVGLVNLDTEFAIPDFRSREKAFQLLADIVFRTELNNARLVIQTYRPDDPVITCLLQGDIKGFLNAELKVRRETNFPPFSRLVTLTFLGDDAQESRREANRMRSYLEKLSFGDKGQTIEVLGPVTVHRRHTASASGRRGSASGAQLAQRLLLKLPPDIMPSRVIRPGEFEIYRTPVRVEVDPRDLL